MKFKCPNCKNRLSFIEKLKLHPTIFQTQKCKHCGATISVSVNLFFFLAFVYVGLIIGFAIVYAIDVVQFIIFAVGMLILSIGLHIVLPVKVVNSVKTD